MRSLDEFLAAIKSGGAGSGASVAASANVLDSIRDRQLMVESGGRHRNPDGSLVRSSADAYGIAQIRPPTAAQPGLGVKPLQNWDDPNESIRFRDDYMAALTDRYGGDVNKALAAYNAGMGNVDRVADQPDWLSHLKPETQNYVQKITGGVPTEIQQAVKATVRPRRSALGPIGNPMTGGTGGNPMVGSSLGSQMHDTGGIDLAGAQAYAEEQRRQALDLTGAGRRQPKRPAIFDELSQFQMGTPQGEASWADWGKLGLYTGAQFAKGVVGLPENLLRYGAGDETSAPKAIAGMGADALAALRRNLTDGSEAIIRSMTPEAQARMQRKWTQLTGEETIWQGGPAEIIASMGMQAVGSLGPTVGPLLTTALLSRIGLGAAASTIYGVSEGYVSGGLTAAQIADDIDNTPTEQLMQVPRFKELADMYGEPKARDMYIGEVQNIVPIASGITTGLLAKAIGIPLDDVFGMSKGMTVGKRFLTTGLVEAAQEAPQSAQEQVVQNYAKMAYDSNTGLFDDVWEQAVQGSALGFIMGGPVGAAFGTRPQKDSRLPDNNKPAPPNVPTDQQDDWQTRPLRPQGPMPTQQEGLPLIRNGRRMTETRGPQLRPGETQGEMFPLGQQETSFLDERAKRDLLIMSKRMSPAEFAAAPEIQQIAEEYGLTPEEVAAAFAKAYSMSDTDIVLQEMAEKKERHAERDQLAPVAVDPNQLSLFDQPPGAGEAPNQGELFPGALPGNVAGDRVALPRLDTTGGRGIGFTMGQAQRELPLGNYPQRRQFFGPERADTSPVPPGWQGQPPDDGSGGGGVLDQSAPSQLQVRGTSVVTPTTTAEIPFAMQPRQQMREQKRKVKRKWSFLGETVAETNYAPEQREVYDQRWLTNALTTIDNELRKSGERIGRRGNVLQVVTAKKGRGVDFSQVDPRQVRFSDEDGGPKIKAALERLAAMERSTAAPTVANSQQGELFPGATPGMLPGENVRAPEMPAEPAPTARRGKPPLRRIVQRGTPSSPTGKWTVTVQMLDENQQPMEVDKQIFPTLDEAYRYAKYLYDSDPDLFMLVEPQRAKLGLKQDFEPVPDLARTPDYPSAESYKRIVAQIRDAKSGRSSRIGTYLPAETVAHLRKIGKYDEVRSMGVTIPNFDGNGGDMVVPDRSTAEQALRHRDDVLASGQDIQLVLGNLTGSGTGKPEGAGTVVQRLNADGVVVAEQLVTDAEAARVADDYKREPGTVRIVPVVQAIKERQAEVIDEAQTGDVAGEARQEGYKRRATAKRLSKIIDKYLVKSPKLMELKGTINDIVGSEPASEREVAVQLADYARSLREAEAERAKATGFADESDLVFLKRYESKDGDTTQEELDPEREQQYAGLRKAMRNAQTTAEWEDAKNKLDAFMQIHRPSRRSVYVAQIADEISAEAVAAEKRLERKTIGSEDRSPSRYVLAKDTVVDRALGDQMSGEDTGGKPERVKAVGPEELTTTGKLPLRVREADRTRPQTLAAGISKIDFSGMTETAARRVKKLFTFINPESGQTSEAAREIPRLLAQWLSDYRAALLEVARGPDSRLMLIRKQRVRREIGIVTEALRNLRNADVNNQRPSTVEEAVPADSPIVKLWNDAEIKRLTNAIADLTTKIKAAQDKFNEALRKVPPQRSLVATSPVVAAMDAETTAADAAVKKLYAQMEALTKRITWDEKHAKLEAELEEAKNSGSEQKVVKAGTRLRTFLRDNPAPKGKALDAHATRLKLLELKFKHRAAMLKSDELHDSKEAFVKRLREADEKAGKPPLPPEVQKLLTEVEKLNGRRRGLERLRQQRANTIAKSVSEQDAETGQILSVHSRAAAVVAKNIYDLVSNSSRWGVGEEMKHAEFEAALERGPTAFLGFLKENVKSRDPVMPEWTKAELDALPEEAINELFLEALGKMTTRRLTDSRESTIIEDLSNIRIWTAEEAARVIANLKGRNNTLVTLPELVAEWIKQDLRGPGKRWFTMADMVSMYRHFWPKYLKEGDLAFAPVGPRDALAPRAKVRPPQGGEVPVGRELPGWEAIDVFALTPQKSAKIKQILRSQEYDKNIAAGRGEKGYGLTRATTSTKNDVPGAETEVTTTRAATNGAYDYRVLTETGLPSSVVDSKARMNEVQAQGRKIYGSTAPDGTHVQGTLEAALATSDAFSTRIRNEYSAFQQQIKKYGSGSQQGTELAYALAFFRQVQDFARAMVSAKPLTKAGIKTAQLLEQDLIAWSTLTPQEFARQLSAMMNVEIKSNVNKTIYAHPAKLATLRNRTAAQKELRKFNSALLNSIAKAAALHKRALDPRYAPILKLLDKAAFELGRTGWPSYRPTQDESDAVGEALAELATDPAQIRDVEEVGNLLANFGFYNEDVSLIRKSDALYGSSESTAELDEALAVTGHVRTGGGVSKGARAIAAESAAKRRAEADRKLAELEGKQPAPPESAPPARSDLEEAEAAFEQARAQRKAKNAETREDSAPDPFESSQLERKLLGSTDDVRTAARSAVDAIEDPGLAASLHEVLVRLNLHLDGSHPLQPIIRTMMKLELLDVEVMFDRRRGARATNWKPDEMGRAIWYRDTPNGPVRRMVVLRHESFQKLRDAGVDPAAAMLHILIHEGTHVSTAAAIDANPALKAAVRQLMDIVEADFARKGLTHVPYAMKSEHEFVAEAFGNPIFQGVLRRIKLSEHQTAWGRFKEIVKSALGWLEARFGYAEQQDNVLEAVMSLTPELFTGANRNLVEKYVAESIQSDAVANVASMAWDRVFKNGEAAKRAKSYVSTMVSSGVENLPDKALSAMTMRQLEEFFAPWFDSDTLERNPLSRYVETYFRRDFDSNVRGNKADRGSRMWTALEESNQTANETVSQLMIDSTYYGIYPNEPFPPDSTTDEVRKTMKNGHLRGPEARQRYEQLRATWDSLAGTGAQEVFTEILSQNEAVVAERTSLMVLNALRAYSLDHRLYEAEAFDRKYVVDMEAGRDDVKDLKLNTLDGIKKEFGDIFTTETKPTDDKPAEEVFDLRAVKTILSMANTPVRHAGPYFTIQRFGDYVVTARKEIAHKTFSSRKDRTEYKRKRRLEDPTIQFWQPAAQDEKGLKDGADFVLREFEYDVRRRKTATEAEAARQELVEKYGIENVSKEPQLTHNWMQGKATIESNEQLQTLLRKLGDNNAAKAALKHFYLQSLAENSFRKYEMNRKNVRGALASEMHRGYNSYMRGAAYYLSQLRYGHKLARYMAQVFRTAEANPAGRVSTVTLQRIAKELQNRDERMTDPEEMGKITRRLGETAQLFLLFTTSYWMLNAMQNYMFTLPYVGARFGESATLSEMLAVQNMIKHPVLSQAITSVAGLRGLFKGGRAVLDNVYTVLDEIEDTILSRTSEEEGARIKQMLEHLKHESIITMTMQTELRQIALGEDTGWFERVMDSTRVMSHLTEVNNRVAAAMTAYRLAYRAAIAGNQRPEDAHKAAIAYAKDVVVKTHFDYSPSNRAPLFANHPLLTQFMTYVQHTYAMFVGAFYRYARTQSPEVRAEIRRQLFGVLGMHLAVGGVVAATFQPIKWAIGLAIALLDGDDDEDETWANIFKGETFNRHVRYAFDAMLGRDAGRLFSLGLPAALGANFSPRVTIGQLYMIDINTESSEGFWGSMVQSFGGAWTSVINNIVLSYNHVQSGNPYRAFETMLPKGLKDVLKTARLYEGGLTDNTGKLILDAKDLDFGDLFLTSIGITPTRLSEKQTARTELYEAKKFRGKKRTSLMNQWYRSSPAERVDLWSKIQQFGETFPEHKITRADLIKGEKRWKDASRRTLLTGAPLSKREAPLAEEEKVYEYD